MTVVKAERADFDSRILNSKHGRSNSTSSPRKCAKLLKGKVKKLTRASYPRSKTGCFTCRKRKKKCDETKPSCQNCIKNNVVCQGYEERREWESKGRNSSSPSRPTPSLPQMIGAVENTLDKQLLSYFTSDLGYRLNIYYERRNPFIDLVIPFAIRNTGLMHSVLCLASSCYIAQHSQRDCTLVLRHSHHFGLAIKDLMKNIDKFEGDDNNSTVLQTIIHCLEATITGNGTGDYRCHLQATQRLITSCNKLSLKIRDFARLFINYQAFSNCVTSLHPVYGSSCITAITTPLPEDKTVWSQDSSGYSSALGDLLAPFARIRHLRDEIRRCRAVGYYWCANDSLLHQAFDIDASLRSWVCHRHQPNTPEYNASLLYRQTAWIYLYRTVKPSTLSTELSQGVDEALTYLNLMFQDGVDERNWTRGTVLPFLFLLGCAAFEPQQRMIITSCFATLQQKYFGNVAQARQVVERIWHMMDQGDVEDATWDWEGVMADMGLDLLVS